MRNNKIDEILQHDDENIKGFFYEYRWLSNYHDCDIFWMGLHFKNTEAAYQASKCYELSNAKLFQTMSGLEAKKHSKTFVARRYWDEMRYNIMAQLIFQKFLVHKDLRELLLATDEKYIEETNYWNDTYWGVCNGIGENNLGKLIMNTRAYFKNNLTL